LWQRPFKLNVGLGADLPQASLGLKGQSDNEIKTDGLHSTGERVWESLAATGENARWSTAHLVRHKDRYFINNDRGDLILAKLSPKGYEELARTPLIKPTSRPGNRREREFVCPSLTK